MRPARSPGDATDGALIAERYRVEAALGQGGAAQVYRVTDISTGRTRALKLLPETDHERRFTTHRLREEILRRLAKRPQQLRELHALRKEADALGEPSKLAQAHCALAQFYIDVGKVNGHALTVVYNHASGYRVGVGDHVTRGEIVGYVGSTGWSTGCHLHFTVLRDGRAVDPMTYL